MKAIRYQRKRFKIPAFKPLSIRRLMQIYNISDAELRDVLRAMDKSK